MQVTVLGITGGVGRAVADAFLAEGHTVVALARTPSKVPAQPGLRVVGGDAFDRDALDAVMAGSEVVFHGLNLPYTDWDPGMVDLTGRVLAAVERTGATLLFPGNLYGLGPDFEAPLTEDAQRNGPSRKGKIRNRLEALLEAASVQTVVLRMGDFFGGVGESTWMFHLTQSVRGGGAIQYPTSHDVLHSWAFVPDVAKTFVALAERRAELPAHAAFHFEGHGVDGATWIGAVRLRAHGPRALRDALPVGPAGAHGRQPAAAGAGRGAPHALRSGDCPDAGGLSG